MTVGSGGGRIYGKGGRTRKVQRGIVLRRALTRLIPHGRRRVPYSGRAIGYRRPGSERCRLYERRVSAKGFPYREGSFWVGPFFFLFFLVE